MRIAAESLEKLGFGGLFGKAPSGQSLVFKFGGSCSPTNAATAGPADQTPKGGHAKGALRGSGSVGTRRSSFCRTAVTAMFPNGMRRQMLLLKGEEWAAFKRDIDAAVKTTAWTAKLGEEEWCDQFRVPKANETICVQEISGLKTITVTFLEFARKAPADLEEGSEWPRFKGLVNSVMKGTLWSASIGNEEWRDESILSKEELKDQKRREYFKKLCPENYCTWGTRAGCRKDEDGRAIIERRLERLREESRIKHERRLEKMRIARELYERKKPQEEEEASQKIAEVPELKKEQEQQSSEPVPTWNDDWTIAQYVKRIAAAATNPLKVAAKVTASCRDWMKKQLRRRQKHSEEQPQYLHTPSRDTSGRHIAPIAVKDIQVRSPSHSLGRDCACEGADRTTTVARCWTNGRPRCR
jgi:hypothetical protein